MTANERLRAALLQQGHTPESLAAAVGVDPKTVERWIGGRTPYRRTRYELAAKLKTDEAYLWPGSYSPAQLASASEAEVIAVHSNRAAVPHETWSRMFDAAEEEIGILVYSGYFLLVDGHAHVRGAYDSNDVKRLDELIRDARYLARTGR